MCSFWEMHEKKEKPHHFGCLQAAHQPAPTKALTKIMGIKKQYLNKTVCTYRPMILRHVFILPVGLQAQQGTLFPLLTPKTIFKSKSGSEEKPYLPDALFLVKQLQNYWLMIILPLLTPTLILTQWAFDGE